MKKNFKRTIVSCYVGLMAQAVVNNFAPLLFLTFQTTYDLSLQMITMLVTVNFLTQLIVDFLAAAYVDRIGYRIGIVGAHVFCAIGLIGLGVFPMIMEPYAGLLLAVVLYGMGGGLLEVLVSPIMEASPTENKAAAMSLLHSFYGWGSVAVIAISTLLFRMFGIENWMTVAFMWALVPIVNGVSFLTAPIAPIVPEGKGMTIRELSKQKIFWLFALIMICSGASEQAMSQWASAFAESGLGVSKTVGDLAGPCFFAALLGFARVVHSKLADKIRIETYIIGCAVLCVFSFILAILPVHPLINLLGCGLSGFAVGVMWPGTCSMASKYCPRGGTAMFGMLALFGDVGCSTGPTLVGMASGAFQDNLKIGLAAATIFPILIVIGILTVQRGSKR